jgi:hypothetical protein
MSILAAVGIAFGIIWAVFTIVALGEWTIAFKEYLDTFK